MFTICKQSEKNKITTHENEQWSKCLSDNNESFIPRSTFLLNYKLFCRITIRYQLSCINKVWNVVKTSDKSSSKTIQWNYKMNQTAENAASGTAMVTWPRCPWLFQMQKFQWFRFSLWVVAEQYIPRQFWLNDTFYRLNNTSLSNFGRVWIRE